MLYPTSFYLLRSTSFSLDDYFSMNDVFRSKNIKKIKEVVKNESFLNAVYFSSRPFYNILQEWLTSENESVVANDKILESLYKYYTRMCTRCTPFGLFSGFSTGEIVDSQSNIIFGNTNQPIFRADMSVIKRLKDEVVKSSSNEKITYYSNNTIVKAEKKINYIEWDKHYNYTLSEVENNFLLEKILDKSQHGLTHMQVFEIISKEMGTIDKDIINDYIKSLIDSRLLVDSLPPYLTTTEDPLLELETYLKEINADTTLLSSVKEMLELSREKLDVSKLDSLIKRSPNILDDAIQPFQIDLKLGLQENKINQKIPRLIIEEIQEILPFLSAINNRNIIQFAENFSKKYESREVSLIQALDPQKGLGYGLFASGNIEITPLIEDICFSYDIDNQSGGLSQIVKHIIDKYNYCLNSSKKEIVKLTEKDLQNLIKTESFDNWAENYCLFGDLLATSFESLDRGNFKFNCKSNLPKPYFLNILGRFAYHDDELTDLIRESISTLNSDYIYAEIIHQPDDSLGNVLLRPEFYSYHIPYISRNKNQDKKIDISDILISVVNGKIILRSRSLNKEIKPRFSSAYNYSQSQLSIITFLCELQYQKVITKRWDWSVLSDRSYLPRVEYKHLILSEARWKLEKNKNCDLISLKEILKRMNVPTFCTLKEADNVLLLDLENDIALNIILKKIKLRDVVLFESLHENYFVTKNNKKYPAEFVFPYQVKTNY